MFDVCTTGDMTHIDTIFKFLPHTRQHGGIDILHCCNDPCLYVSEVTWRWWDEYFARNARCTVTTDLLCDIPTHKTTPPLERPFSHYIHSHRLAAELWTMMINNLRGGKNFELFLQSLQVSIWTKSSNCALILYIHFTFWSLMSTIVVVPHR